MQYSFDIFDKYEMPVITLANPNKEELGQLGCTIGLNLTYNFNAVSEVNFTYPYQDVNEVISPYYSQIENHRLLHLTNHGWWLIQDVNDSDDGITKTKTVTAYSLEYELASKKINLLDGTYPLYSVGDPSNSLLYQVLSGTGWSVGYIDSTLLGKYRTFEISDDTVYSFLMNTVRNSYECFFMFDTEKREVSAYTINSILKQTDIFIGYDNLIKQCEVTATSNELYTAISVYGDEELDISYANPLGGLTIYNYDYFKKSDWMSEELINALDNWERLIQLNEDRYRAALLNLINSDIDVETLNTQLVDLKTDLAALEQVQGLQISGNIPNDDPDTYEKTLQSIGSVNEQIAAVESQIKSGKTNSNVYQDILDDIHSVLKRENNFTSEQLAELALYTKEATFQDDTFITTDIMTQAEIQNVTIDLYDAGKQALKTYSHPSYTITVDAINYLLLKEYIQFTDQTDLGTTLNLEVDRGQYIEAILLSIYVNFDDPTDFKITFGNRYRLASAEWQFSDLYNTTSNITNKINFSYNIVKDWTSRSNDVLDFINGTLNATKNSIISTTNQEMIMDGSGLHGRKLTSTGYDPKQMWLTSNTMAFTKDNWETVSLALGELTLPDGTTTYGLVGEALIGKIIVGSELYISNEVSNFVIDTDGISIKVGDNDNLVNITTTIDGINTEITNAKGDISLLEQTAASIKTSISNIEGDISSLEQTATSIKASVASISGRVNSIEITLDGIDFDGFVTFYDLERKGGTTINGSNITTGKISADYIDVSSITLDDLTDGVLYISKGQVQAESILVTGDLHVCGATLVNGFGLDNYGSCTWSGSFEKKNGGTIFLKFRQGILIDYDVEYD